MSMIGPQLGTTARIGTSAITRSVNNRCTLALDSASPVERTSRLGVKSTIRLS